MPARHLLHYTITATHTSERCAPSQNVVILQHTARSGPVRPGARVQSSKVLECFTYYSDIIIIVLATLVRNDPLFVGHDPRTRNSFASCCSCQNVFEWEILLLHPSVCQNVL